MWLNPDKKTIMAAVEEDGKETENERNLQADKTPDIRQILFSSCRVACKGFLIGGSLYAGLGLLSAVSSKKLFARYAIDCCIIVCKQLVLTMDKEGEFDLHNKVRLSVIIDLQVLEHPM